MWGGENGGVQKETSREGSDVKRLEEAWDKKTGE
jgi:hypothetical protein